MSDLANDSKEAALLTGLLAGCLAIAAICSPVNVALAGELSPSQPKAASAPSDKLALAAPSSANWRTRQGLYFKRNWGVEIVGVKPVSSGYMLAFRYRILDPEKAKILNDRKAKAYIIDEATGTVLAVPAMENVGELRSGSTPEADRVYFMIFGNPGKLVKSGSRISIVAGNFRADGLVVD